MCYNNAETAMESYFFLHSLIFQYSAISVNFFIHLFYPFPVCFFQYFPFLLSINPSIPPFLPLTVFPSVPRFKKKKISYVLSFTTAHIIEKMKRHCVIESREINQPIFFT